MGKAADEFTYQAHLFHTKKKLDTGEEKKLMRTDEEKKQRNEKTTEKEKLVTTRRLQKFLPRSSPLQKTLAQRLASHKSKTSKQTKSKKSKFNSGSPAAASSTSRGEPQKNNLDDEEKPSVVHLQCYL